MFSKKNNLSALVSHQAKTLFNVDIDVSPYQDQTLERVFHCFEHTKNKYYNLNGKVSFSYLNSSQYAIYLYYLANTIYQSEGPQEKCDMLYYLNKTLNNIDWYYQISLPGIFGVEHPLGTIMGRASYSNGFYFFQGCTVGGNITSKGILYPVLGENVIMFSNSSILGDSNIGNNVIISANTLVINTDIPDNSIVFGQSKNLTIKSKPSDYFLNMFSNFWKNDRKGN